MDRDNMDCDNIGCDNMGCDNMGRDNMGCDNMGCDNMDCDEPLDAGQITSLSDHFPSYCMFEPDVVQDLCTQ